MLTTEIVCHTGIYLTHNFSIQRKNEITIQLYYIMDDAGFGDD